MISPCVPIFNNVFADDTAFLIADNDPHPGAKKLNRALSWLQINKLTLNLIKTKTIVCNKPKPPTGTSLNINCKGVLLEPFNSTKYLGTITDSNLTWKEQIASVEKVVTRGCHALFKLQPISDIKKNFPVTSLHGPGGKRRYHAR